MGILDEDPDLTRGRDGHTIIGEPELPGPKRQTHPGRNRIRPPTPGLQGRNRTTRGPLFSKPLRQVIQSTNDICNGQLALERQE